MANKHRVDITVVSFSLYSFSQLIDRSIIIYKLYISNHWSKHNNILNNIRNLTWSLDSNHDGLNSNLRITLDEHMDIPSL